MNQKIPLSYTDFRSDKNEWRKKQAIDLLFYYYLLCNDDNNNNNDDDDILLAKSYQLSCKCELIDQVCVNCFANGFTMVLRLNKLNTRVRTRIRRRTRRRRRERLKKRGRGNECVATCSRLIKKPFVRPPPPVGFTRREIRKERPHMDTQDSRSGELIEV